MKLSRLVSIFCLIYCLQVAASAQDVRATARVDSNSMTIGDQVKLYLDVQYPSTVTVTIPPLADSLDEVEVVERGAPVVKQNGTNVLQSLTFTLTSFDSGMHVIPPLTIRYNSTGDDTTNRTVETAPDRKSVV